ncbi:TPA: TIGR01620 family protein [Providencia stuartii]|uniref:YcjF family protein n=1 Tax=Providencia TaxID=586 RepID=UPI00090A4541|nr:MULTISPECIES: YcjF family protein [Providencia]APG49741.1 TIGR01620 family protein [Providencia stuartii]AVL40463.1 TIGR01620 family protein [Providencia stuartii]MBG5903233.1 TIGR01620 family protein [Providencia stuartii]MBG5911767.1 TIGR01620 family protein [Providencia stuartii]MBG5914806.1 TIGR01620 family protein [Providencia stuartii]
MNEPIKQRVDFSEEDIAAEAEKLRKARHFDPQEQHKFTPVEIEAEQDEQEGEVESLINEALKPKRSFWRRLVGTAVGIFAVSVMAQLGIWIHTSWVTQDWTALGTAAAGGLIVVAGVGSIATEWRRLYRLKERAQERDIARELLHSHGMGQGKVFCEKLAKQSALSEQHPAVQRWQATIQETHNDREMVELYSKLVQPILDEQARKEISRSSAESALMIAVSPLAIVDMAFIAWRNIRLINRIAAIYGIELGYYSRIRLFRMVLINIAFAGASELIREVGMDWLSQDITARLSTRAAQGIGAGLLTARLGIKAMELCRPLPWIDDKPRLADFRGQLLSQIKNAVPSKKDAK